MSMFGAASALNGFRRRREQQHALLQASAAPPAEHPVLGLGGRSIELSLGQHEPVDVGAFELAVDELHEHVSAGDAERSELRRAAAWLLTLPRVDGMPEVAVETLRADIATLGG